MSERREIPFDDTALRALLECATDTVLIGGQSLAFWVAHYAIPIPRNISFISSDADLLGWNHTAKQLTAALGGIDVSPKKHQITALAGQVLVPAGAREYRNIDILHRIIGFDDEDAVRRRSLAVTLNGISFRVMHPLDVLKSRLENLRRLPDKQTVVGITQGKLAVDVVRRFIDELLVSGSERVALKAANRVAKIAKETAGVVAFVEYHIDALAAVRPERFRTATFISTQWPRVVDAVARLRSKRTSAKRNRDSKSSR